MCIKRVGVEIALMEGARPISIALHVYVDERLQCKLPLKRDALPVRRPLAPWEERFLGRDQRKRGERRPKRLTYGPCHRAPYTFYSARLPSHGLHPTGTLRLELWMELYDPMWPYAPLFHFKCSDPKVHPLTKRTHWIEHRHLTMDSMLGRTQLHCDLTECECGVRVRMELDKVRGEVKLCNTQPSVRTQQPELVWNR